MSRPEVIDAQLHLWGADTPQRPWPRVGGVPGAAHLARSPTAGELLAAMDAAGVDGAILVPPSWEGERNDLALAAAAAAPQRFAVMGRLSLADPAVSEELTGWRSTPGLLGVRLTLHRSPWSEWFAQGRLDWFWTAAEQAQLPVAVYAPAQYAALGAVAAAHPGLRLLVDHLGLPLAARDEAAFALLAELAGLARHPNIAVKATAVPGHSDGDPPFTAWHRPLLRLVEQFGAHRVFWGSDLTRLPCTYRECVDLFARDLAFLDECERTWILGRGIRTWLDWPGSTSTQMRIQVQTQG